RVWFGISFSSPRYSFCWVDAAGPGDVSADPRGWVANLPVAAFVRESPLGHVFSRAAGGVERVGFGCGCGGRGIPCVSEAWNVVPWLGTVGSFLVGRLGPAVVGSVSHWTNQFFAMGDIRRHGCVCDRWNSVPVEGMAQRRAARSNGGTIRESSRRAGDLGAAGVRDCGAGTGDGGLGFGYGCVSFAGAEGVAAQRSDPAGG